MNATTIECDQTEEETLNLFTYEVSDEALEAAAGIGAVPMFTQQWACTAALTQRGCGGC